MAVTLSALISAAASDQHLEGSVAANVCQQVRAHRLGPLAHACGVSGFSHDAMASSLFWQRTQALAEEAIAAIGRVGVPVLLLKGVALARQLYAEPGERPMSDIDLLVPAGAHREAVRALERIGYWIAGPAAERGRFHHAATLKRQAAAIDLHRSIVQPLRRGARIHGLWQRARRAPAPLSGALVADPIDTALLVLVHIARHELLVPAINYVDASRALASLSPPQRATLHERSRNIDLGRGVTSAIEMASYISTETPCPARLQSVCDDILARREPGRPQQVVRKLALLDGPGDALRLLAGTVLEHLGF